MRSIISLVLAVLAVALPVAAAPQDYRISPDNTGIAIDWVVLGLSRSKAHFTQFSGRLHLDKEAPAKSSLEVAIRAESLESGNERRDKRLKSDKFFDAGAYPHAVFKSTGVEILGDRRSKIFGDLTIKGITRSIAIDVELDMPDEEQRANEPDFVFKATAEIRRSDFGMAGYRPFVSDKVGISIEARFSNACRLSAQPGTTPADCF